MSKLLESLSPGQSARISAIHATDDFRRRLVALGLKPGNRIQLVRKGFFAGPLQVRIGTTDIIIRRSDARHIEISTLNGNEPGLKSQ